MFGCVIEDQIWVPTNGCGEHNWLMILARLKGDSAIFDLDSTKLVDGVMSLYNNLELRISKFIIWLDQVVTVLYHFKITPCSQLM